MPKVKNPSAFSIAVLVASIVTILCAGEGTVRAETQSLTGRVVGVHDGDSITVLAPGNDQLKVRLEGIDAPELKQPFSQQSKQALSDLVYGKAVVLRVTGKDRYRRTLAVVMVEGVNANLEMVKLGMAWRFDKYTKDAALLAAQEAAKAAKLGLWSDIMPTAPWEWRAKPKPKPQQ